ncbi:MAG: DUF5777 family beta-barrel protein [Planctomycetota bacterium]
MKNHTVCVALAMVCALSGAEGAATANVHRFELKIGAPFAWAPTFNGKPTAYRAENVPPGLIVDPRTGAVGGNPTTPGTWNTTIFASNRLGEGSSRMLIIVTGIPTVPPPPPPPAADNGEGEDEADPMLALTAKLYPCTEVQRRTIYNCFLPTSSILSHGQWFYRISHVSRETYYHDPRTNLLGLDDNVKIGLMVGYGIAKNMDLTLQRSNGYDLQLGPTSDGEPARFDSYDIMAKWKFLDRLHDNAWVDAALMFGTTEMVRNQGAPDTSLNLGIMLERDVLDDRLRLGVGIVHAGLSVYEKTLRLGPPTKILPSEYEYLSSQGLQPSKRDESSTTAVPVTAKFAITPRWALLAEAVFPIAGYSTGQGPALAAGFRINTNTHEFSFYGTNSGNTAFNSVVTGGNQPLNLNLFAFSISAYF